MNLKSLTTALGVLTIVSFARGEDWPFTVDNPRDNKSAVYEDVQHLIAHLKGAKAPDFIFHRDATKNLKWRLEHVNILAPNAVAVVFTEGHVEAIGIYVRNYKDRAWVLNSGINGNFKIRSFSDDSLKTEKNTKG
jgi:hypothetical protein